MKLKEKLKTVPYLLKGFMNAHILPGRLKDKPLFSLAVIADSHTDGNFYRDRTDILRLGLSSITRYNRSLDVLAMAGDNTNCGDESEYANLDRLIKAFVRAKNIVPAIGNHDSWHQSISPDYKLAKRLYLEFCSRCGIKTDSVYFSVMRGGRRFICLGTQDLDDNDAKFYEDQFTWFREELTRAQTDENEVIILLHYPLYGRNGVLFPGTDTEYSRRLDEILTECSLKLSKPAFLFTGHCHFFCDKSIEKVNDKLYCINLPSFEYGYKTPQPDGTMKDVNNGSAGILNVYADRTELEIRNFIDSKTLLSMTARY